MNVARRVLWISALTALIFFAAAPAIAFVPPQGGQSAYELPLREFDLFNYHSAATEADRTQAGADLSRTYGGVWSVYSWNPQSRTPSQMIGSGVEVAGSLTSSNEVRVAAEQIIRANPTVFKADLDGLRFTEATSSPPVPNPADGYPRPGKWAAHFQQTYRDIDVVGGEVHMTFTDRGRLFALGSTYYPNINVDTSPSISADRAKEIARGSLPYDPKTDSVESDAKLLILPVPQSETQVEYHLVWLVRVHTQEPVGIWATSVDAHAGTILKRTNETSFLDFYGTAVGQIERTSYCDGQRQEGLSYLYVSVSGVGSVYADDYGNWDIPYGGGGYGLLFTRLYSPYVDVQNANGANAGIQLYIPAGAPYQINFNDANSRADERDAYQEVNNVHDFFETFAAGWGFTNARITAYVNINNTCNAYWNGEGIHFYKAGNGCANTGQMLGVIAHEYGHGVQNAILGQQGDQGLGEGNGDVLGFLMTDESVVGRGFYNCSGGIRDCHNTLRYPGDVIGQEIHDAGRVIAGFHWDAEQDQIARYGSWGKYSAAWDWHYGRVLQHPLNQPDQVLATFIANDDDGDLTNGTPQFDSYCLAATNHGFTCPAAKLPIADGVCDTYYQCPQSFRINQQHVWWTAVAVNPAPGDDKDMRVYTDDGSTLLASSTGTQGTDFVVGDFNSNPLGYYQPYVSYGGANTPFVVEWDDGADTITLGSDIYGSVGGPNGNCGLVRMWDVYLQAGTTYRFALTQTSGAADIRMSFFRNPTTGAYWAGRYSSTFELTAGSVQSFTAPASDYYGVVVFNNSAGSPSGTYDLRVQEAPVAMASGGCLSYSTSPKMFSIDQENVYWTGVAVNPSGSDDKDIVMYSDPDGLGSPLAYSMGTQGTDFIVGDFNSNALGTYYPRIQYGNISAPYVVEWDDGPDWITPGTPVSGAVGGGSGSCGLIQVWDLYMNAGDVDRFLLQTSGSADIRVCLFRNPASGTYWAGRASAEFEVGNNSPISYTAPASDWYGVVVFNSSPSSPSGSYTLTVRSAPIPLADGTCQNGSVVQQMYSFSQSNIYWSCVGINPAVGDDKDIFVYDNPDGIGNYLGYSSGVSGTDYVVGDFNHNPTGTYYALATYGTTPASYVVDWDDGPDFLPIGPDVVGTVGGGGGGGCGLVKVWDVYLNAGSTYRVYLSTGGDADIRVSLFRNPNSATYWAGRSGAEFELQSGTPYSYTAPAADYYGVVVFNASPGSPGGNYDLRFQLAPIALTSATCQSQSASPQMFSFSQTVRYWTAAAVNPDSGDDKDMAVYADPDGVTTPLANSQYANGTDFVVGDFNHMSNGTFYPRVTSGLAYGTYTVEWDDGRDTFPFSTDVNGSVGGGSGDCGLIRIWDIPLTAGSSYQFTLTKSGTARIKAALFENPGSGAYWVGRAGAVFEKFAPETPFVYTAPTTDLYGVVVFNNSEGGLSGTYTLRVDPVTVPRPDLFIEQIAIQPSHPTIATPVQIRALVKNQGNADAGASATRFWLDNVVKGDVATPAIPMGTDVWTDWLNLGLLTQGNHTDQACADIANVVVESNENNNCLTGQFTVGGSSGVDDVAGGRPGLWYANPYPMGGAIVLRAPEEGGHATVSIYNVQGRCVRTLVNESASASARVLHWDGCTDGGSRLGAGVYFVHADVGSLHLKKTLLLLR